MTHFFAQLFNGDIIVAVVSGDRGSLLVPLPDLALQLRVGFLQGAHFLQVSGQTVVEVLHGGLLVETHTEAIVTPAERAGQVETAPAALCVRDAHAGAPCTCIDTWRTTDGDALGVSTAERVGGEGTRA